MHSIADDVGAIARRMEEIEAEREAHVVPAAEAEATSDRKQAVDGFYAVSGQVLDWFLKLHGMPPRKAGEADAYVRARLMHHIVTVLIPAGQGALVPDRKGGVWTFVP